MNFNLDAYLDSRRQLVDQSLAQRLETIAQSTPETLVSSMRYSLLAGGKRLRPILCLAACEAVGGAPEDALDVACALEMIHTYSLIHDDLPSMDNDDFRRGRPTSHKVYGEAVAILTGDALLTESFRVALESRHRDPRRAALLVDTVFEMASAAGAAGMVGGQVIDIEATGKRIDLPHLERLHHGKTGELLLVSVRAGGRLGGAQPAELDRLTRYGRSLGLAFQIIDDVLDVTADLATLGKDPGSDREAGKTTFVDLLGIEAARTRAREVMASGISALEPLGERAEALRALARFTVERDR